METTDTALLARWGQRRDSDAFMELVMRHSAMVYATALRVLSNRSDAEEVTQECFLELARAHSRIRQTVAGWLYSVAVKQATMRIRSESRRRTREKVYAERQSETHEPEWEEIRPELDAAIAALPAGLREAIVARFLAGLTYEAAANQLGVPASTLQYRIQKGIEELRTRLAARGVAVGAGPLALMLESSPADAATLPTGLTASLGKMFLAKGVIAAAGAEAPVAGAVAGTKLGLATWLFVAALMALGIVGVTFVFDAGTELPMTGAVVSGSPQPDPPAEANESTPPPADPASLAAAPENEESTIAAAVDPAPSGNVSGIVLDAKTGEPMPGLALSIQRYFGNPPYGGVREIGMVTTDAMGRFAFDAAVAGYYWLWPQDDFNAVYEGGGIELLQGGEEESGVTVKVGPGASISGRVYDVASGAGIKGVKALTDGGRRSAETDADGRYVLTGIRAGMPSLNLENTGPYVNTLVLGSGDGHFVNIKAGQQVENVDFSLERGTELRGIVVNDSGEPLVEGEAVLSGLLVTESGQKQSYIRGKIDREGRFLLEGVKPGQTYRSLSIAGARTANEAQDHTYWPLSEFGEIQPWSGERRFVLERAARIDASVIDAATNEAIPAFEFTTDRKDDDERTITWPEDHRSTRGEGGHFTCMAPKGGTTVLVRADGYAVAAASVDSASPGEVVEVEIPLHPGGFIEGTVKDSGGKPVQGACIIPGQVPEGNHYAKERVALVRSDLAGRFQVTVEPGAYDLTAWVQGLREDRAEVEIAAGATSKVDFVLGTGARIRGRITADGNSSGISVTMKYAIHTASGEIKGDEVYDAGGQYEIAGLAAGDGVLVITASLISGARQEVVVPVHTVDGEDTVVNYDFATGLASIQGSVTVDGQPAERGYVTAYLVDEQGALNRALAPIDYGAYRIETAAAGPITLVVPFYDGSTVKEHRVTVNAQPNEVVTCNVDIVSSGGATIEGRLAGPVKELRLQSAEIGLLEGTFTWEDRRFAEYHMTTALAASTGANGDFTYRLENIADGDYTLVFCGKTDSGRTWLALNHVQVRNGQSQSADLKIE